MVDLLTAVRHLQELQEKATPGPWEVAFDGRQIVRPDKTTISMTQSAAFIAEAVNLVGPLIEDWERREEALRDAENVLVHIATGHDPGHLRSSARHVVGVVRAALALPGGQE